MREDVFYRKIDDVLLYSNALQAVLSPNVSLQLTLAFASANANVPDVEPLTSGGTRAEERASATQQLYAVLGEVLGAFFQFDNFDT